MGILLIYEATHRAEQGERLCKKYRKSALCKNKGKCWHRILLKTLPRPIRGRRNFAGRFSNYFSHGLAMKATAVAPSNSETPSTFDTHRPVPYL